MANIASSSEILLSLSLAPCSIIIVHGESPLTKHKMRSTIHHPPSTTVIDSEPYSKYNCSIHFPYLLNEFLCIVSMFLFFSIFPCCLFLYDFINCRNGSVLFSFSFVCHLCRCIGCVSFSLLLLLFLLLHVIRAHIRKFIQSNHMRPIKAWHETFIGFM